MYDKWKSTDEREWFADMKYCIDDASCSEIADGECYDDEFVHLVTTKPKLLFLYTGGTLSMVATEDPGHLAPMDSPPNLAEHAHLGESCGCGRSRGVQCGLFGSPTG